MFLRCTTRKKNGKEHRYWNLVENRRVAGGQVVQRQVLYLGEINDSQCEVWRKSIEVFEDGRSAPRTVAPFAEEQTAPIDDEQIIQVRLKDLEVRNALSSVFGGVGGLSRVMNNRSNWLSLNRRIESHLCIDDGEC